MLPRVLGSFPLKAPSSRRSLIRQRRRLFGSSIVANPRPLQLSAAASCSSQITPTIASVPKSYRYFSATQHFEGNGHGEEEEKESSSSNSTTTSVGSELKAMFPDETKPVAEHLDPDGTNLPTSSWIEVKGILPNSSLDMVLEIVIRILEEEIPRGIIDLEALWNPHDDDNDGLPFLEPLMPFSIADEMTEGRTDSNDNPRRRDFHYRSLAHCRWIEAAHLRLSPFGRPAGWVIKLNNRSIVNAVLTHAQENRVLMSWKLLNISEYHPTQNDINMQVSKSGRRGAHHKDMFPCDDPRWIDDSVLRVENIPHALSIEELRMSILSNYDLANDGPTIIPWKGSIQSSGKKAPPMHLVRFLDESWARAALRDLQSMECYDRTLLWAPYPKQLLYDSSDDDDSNSGDRNDQHGVDTNTEKEA